VLWNSLARFEYIIGILYHLLLHHHELLLVLAHFRREALALSLRRGRLPSTGRWRMQSLRVVLLAYDEIALYPTIVDPSIVGVRVVTDSA